MSDNKVFVRVRRVAPLKVEPNVTIEMDYETAQALRELLYFVPDVRGSWAEGLIEVRAQLTCGGVYANGKPMFLVTSGRITPLMKPAKENV